MTWPPFSKAEVRPNSGRSRFNAPRISPIVGRTIGCNYDRFANIPPSRNRLVYPTSDDFCGFPPASPRGRVSLHLLANASVLMTVFPTMITVAATVFPMMVAALATVLSMMIAVLAILFPIMIAVLS